jgi:hypothetical protein
MKTNFIPFRQTAQGGYAETIRSFYLGSVLIRRKGVSTFRFLNLVGTGNLNLKNNIMKFTKEELETVGKFIDEYTYYSPPISLSDYLDQCKKPETKKIIVEIEYKDFNNNKIGAGDVKTSIENYSLSSHWNFKVTELPEVFSREDIMNLKMYMWIHSGNTNDIDNWLSERNK